MTCISLEPSTFSAGRPWPRPRPISSRGIVSVYLRFQASAPPAGGDELWPGAGGLRHPAGFPCVWRTLIPVSYQGERIRCVFGARAAVLPYDHIGVKACVLRNATIVGPAGDEGAASLAGHAGTTTVQRPAANVDKFVDEPRSSDITGREDKGANDAVKAVLRLIDRVSAWLKQRGIHFVVT